MPKFSIPFLYTISLYDQQYTPPSQPQSKTG
jgi:hypothetical protein